MNEHISHGRSDKNEDGSRKRTASVAAERTVTDKPLHPTWREFLRYCAELQHGEIELLKIQDGLPVLAEVIKKKIRFGRSSNL